MNNDPEQKNRELAGAGVAAFKEEVKKTEPGFVKDCRMRYLQDAIAWQKKQIANLYRDYEKDKQGDVPYWLRALGLEWGQVKEREKNLGWMEKELANLKAGKEETGITEDMIERARNYPIEKLIEAKRSFALCPFHDDKHPSLYLRNNFYHCFTCKASGDTISLLMNRDGLSFPEAVKALQ